MAALGGLVAYASLAGAQAPEPDRSPRLLIVPESARAQAALAGTDARVVAMYGDFTLVEARGEDDADLRAAGAARRDDLREVSLPGRSALDPLRERPSLAAKGAADPAEALVLAQFVGPVKDAWVERLQATGARIVEYVAQNGYVLHASGAEVDRLAGLVGTYPAVRAVTRVAAADKISDSVATVGGAQPVAVQTVAGAEGEDARRAAAAAGVRVRVPSSVGELRTQFLTLTGAEIETLATDPAVVAIAPAPAPRLADERAAQIVAGNVTGTSTVGPPTYLSWLSGRGFGSGTFDFVIDVTDEGLDNGSVASPGHPDFRENGSGASRVAYAHNFTGDSSARDCGGHGTNVASIALGYNAQPDTSANHNDGSGYNYGLGVAPRAKVGASKIFDCNGDFAAGFSPTAVADAAYVDGARISNNSWSNTNDLGGYNIDSREYDALVRDAQLGQDGNQQMVEVFAAGNEGNRGSQTGYGSVTSPGSAKNVITVGASESVRLAGLDGCNVDDPHADSARDILDFSSRGPTDDGRQKPDLVAPGTHIVGASPQHGGYDGEETCNEQFPDPNPFYSLVSGTSQAAPAVSGAAALIREWYSRPAQGGVVPSPALTKALLVNTATDLAGGSDGKGTASMGSAPNADQGWGRVNVGNVLDSTEREFVDQSTVLTDTGLSARRGYSVADSSKPVKVTLAWTDPPAAVDANPALVNDLDLVVTAGGRSYRGNVLSGGVSRTGGAPDARNNLETVILPPGTAGRFAVRVGGTNIAADGVPGVGDATDQDFAMVVSNASSAPVAPQLADDGTLVSDSGAGGDSDGALEPGESVTISQRVVNEGDAPATEISGVLGGGVGLTIEQGFSAFPDAAPGGQTTGQTGFRASLSTAATCGADVTATLALTTAQGAQGVPVTLPTGSAGPPSSSSSSAGPLAIPDDNSLGAASSLTVGTSGAIKDVDVSIAGINHPFVGDLALELSHGGVTVELTRHPGGPDNNGDNMAGTVFDDEAPLNVSQGTAPYTGSFRPQNDQLSRFDGLDKSGTWTLRVRDLFDGDLGTLAGWGTSVRSAVCDPVTGDSTPPAVTLSAPANGSSTTDTTPLLSGTAGVGAGDQSRVTTSIYPGSAAGGAPAQELEAERNASSGAWSREPAALAPGTYTARAQQSDSAGNVGSSAPVTFKVLSPAPSFVIASANERLVDALAGRLTVFGACASACNANATLSVTAHSARRLGVAPGRSAARVTLGRGSKRLSRSGSLGLPVRMTKKARAGLRRSDGLTAKLRVEVKVGGRVAMTLDRPVKLGRSAGLGSIARKGMPLWTSCSRTCPLGLELWVDARTARGLGLKAKGAKRVRVAAKKASVSSRGSKLTLKMKRSTGAAVARRSRLTASLEAVAGAKPNPTSSTKRSLVLRR